MRFLNILNADMLGQRLERMADRNALSALVGAIRFSVEMHGDQMPDEKRKNLTNVAEFADKVIESNSDLESTVVALYDSATQHADEVKVLRLENAGLKLKVQSLEEQLKIGE